MSVYVRTRDAGSITRGGATWNRIDRVYRTQADANTGGNANGFTAHNGVLNSYQIEPEWWLNRANGAYRQFLPRQSDSLVKVRTFESYDQGERIDDIADTRVRRNFLPEAYAAYEKVRLQNRAYFYVLINDPNIPDSVKLEWMDLAPRGPLDLSVTGTTDIAIERALVRFFRAASANTFTPPTVPSHWVNHIGTPVRVNLSAMARILQTVVHIEVTAGGTGYTTAPLVTVAAPTGTDAPVTATATATVAGGAVTGITITNSGGAYISAPAVTFGGAGTGATATAHLPSAVPQNTNVASREWIEALT